MQIHFQLLFPNGKRYIGLTTDVERRWSEHRAKAASGSPLPLHCAIRKYGAADRGWYRLGCAQERGAQVAFVDLVVSGGRALLLHAGFTHD